MTKLDKVFNFLLLTEHRKGRKESLRESSPLGAPATPHTFSSKKQKLPKARWTIL